MDRRHYHLFAITVVLLTIVSSLSADSSVETARIALCWGSNFSSGSPYQANLDNLVNGLASGAAASGGFFNYTFGNPPGDVVYGVAMCYVDSRWADCRRCLDVAPSSAFTECPYSRNAAILYRDCALRYSESSFSSGETDQGHVLNLWVSSYVDDVASWNNTRWTMMNQLIEEAAASPARFANGSEVYVKDNASTVYGLVQCRQDLTAEACKGCLTYQLQYLLGGSPDPNNVNMYADVRGFSCLAKLDRHPIILMVPPGKLISSSPFRKPPDESY